MVDKVTIAMTRRQLELLSCALSQAYDPTAPGSDSDPDIAELREVSYILMKAGLKDRDKRRGVTNG